MSIPSNVAVAMLLLVGGNGFATLADVVVKALGNESAIFQYLWLRQVVSVVICLPFFWQLPRSKQRPVAIGVHLLRAHLGIVGASCTLIALLHLSLATANVIFYAAPLLTVVATWVVLKEKVKMQRLINAFIGFVGIFIVLRPDQLHWASAVALIVALSITAFNLLVVKLPGNISVTNVMVWTNICALPVTTLLAIITWEPMTMVQLVDLLILGVASAITIGIYHACVVVALLKAPPDATAIAEYSGLLFAALFGYWFFSESLDIYTWVGMSIIFFSMLLQLIQEKRSTLINH